MSFIDLTNVISSHLDAGALPNIAESSITSLQHGAAVAYLGKYLGAGLTMLAAAGAVGAMQGFATANSVQAVAQLEAQPKILSTMIVISAC